MSIALSIPCFINQVYPEVALSCIQLMKKLEVDFEVPKKQSCCGQPLANSGYEGKAKSTYRRFVKTFGKYDKTLMISGSCSYHVSHHYDNIKQTDEVRKVRENIQDLTSYVLENYIDQLKVVDFPYKVALHVGCHSLRGLKLGVSTELAKPTRSFLLPFISKMKDVEIIKLDRPDECCGFGGTFSVFYDDLSVRMGADKLEDAVSKGVEVIVSNDMSCLLHQEGIIKKRNLPIKVMHILQVLNGDKP